MTLPVEVTNLAPDIVAIRRGEYEITLSYSETEALSADLDTLLERLRPPRPAGPGLQENGTTQRSLNNGARLLEMYGARPYRLQLAMARDRKGDLDYFAEASWENGVRHTFRGFSWGYGGEGPRGLAAWCAENDVPLMFAEIAKFENARPGLVYDWRRPGG
jgi:hypothetical protein